MSTGDPLALVKASGVVPVVTLERSEHVLPLCEALLEGGLHVLEITYRSAAAAGAIGMATQRYPDMLVGAGTVTTSEMAWQAHAQGARFAVAPGFNPAVVVAAQQVGLQFWPGVCTPTEMEQALAFGCKVQKFFPAVAMGGPPVVRAMLAPFLHLGVELIPTGAIDEDSAPEYWALEGVAAVGGSWVAPAQLIANAEWSEITRRARATVVRHAAVHGGEM